MHGTDEVMLKDNVAYDVVGHCYFLEDGVEEENRLVHNLGMLTKEGAIIESDERPATFWITNPNNILKRNAAAGSEGAGFWYFLLDEPTGLHAEVDIQPRTIPLGEFDNNTAHTNERDGLDVDGFQYGGFASYRPAEEALFTDFSGYKNGNFGVWFRGTDLTVRHATLLDNKIGASLVGSPNKLAKSTVVGTSKTPDDHNFLFILGYSYYDGPQEVKDTTFRHFQSQEDQPQAAFGMQQNNPYAISLDNFYHSVTLKDANRFYFQDVERNGEKFAIVTNTDTGSSAVPLHDFHNGPGCEARTDWNAYMCADLDYGRLTFSDRRSSGYFTELEITRLDTNASIDMIEEGNSTGGRFLMNLPSEVNYRFDQGNVDGMKLKYEDAEDSITVRIPFDTDDLTIIEVGFEHDVWEYDADTDELVLELRPEREYQIFKN